MEHRGLTFALCISTSRGELKGRGDLRSHVCLHYCNINIKLHACNKDQLSHSLQWWWWKWWNSRIGRANSERMFSVLNNNQQSEVNSVHKQCSTLSPVLVPLVDLRPAYPVSPAPNGLDLRNHDWLLVQPEQHVTQKATHPQGTCISSNPICSFVLQPAHSSLFVSLFLSQLRPTIPSDLKRLNQCLCQTTSRQPLATADIIHLFLLTNLSIHSTGNETSPFCREANCLSAATCWQKKSATRTQHLIHNEESSKMMWKWHRLHRKGYQE